MRNYSWIGWMLVSLNVLQASPRADSALLAATMMARSWQLESLESLPRWEAMNLVLTGENRTIPTRLAGAAVHQWEALWWRHAQSLPQRWQDSLQKDLGLLELLHHKIQTADEAVDHLLKARRNPDPAGGLAQLQSLAVALEDAGVVQARLRHHLQDDLQYYLALAQTSPPARARQHFRSGMEQARAIIELVKTGRRLEAETSLRELRHWLERSPSRRQAWRSGLDPSARTVLEPIWIRWEQVMHRFVIATEDWLRGTASPALLGAAAGRWSRQYQCLNHQLMPLFGARDLSLVALLESFWAASASMAYPEPGVYPCYRPLGRQDPPQAIGPAPQSWIFVVDVSGSMEESERIPLFRRALAVWAARLPADHHISMIAFSDTSQWMLKQVPAANLSDVLAETKRLSGRGETKVLSAMDMAYGLAKSSIVPSRVVLVSDGGLRYDHELARRVEEGNLMGIHLDAVFLPGKDARYEIAFRRLVEIGGGNWTSLTTSQPVLNLERAH